MLSFQVNQKKKSTTTKKKTKKQQKVSSNRSRMSVNDCDCVD